MDWLRALVATVAILVACWLLVVAILWLNRPSRELAGPALRLLPDTFRLVAGLVGDPTIPRGPRLALVLLAGWLAMPIDLVPDFLPVIGQLDDLILAVLVLRYVGRHLGREVIHARWTGSPDSLALLERLLWAGE